jgi:2-amino-4-hydroxy-6-hydroxymethyldihydropteridine diphosphokinase
VVSRAFVGIGANQGDPVGQVREALRVLGSWGPLRASSLWRSEPLVEGPSQDPQAWYVNAVAELELGGDAFAFLERLHAVERDFGRPATRPRWAPRALDLDLLLFADQVLTSDRLTLPHPGLATRRFVLAPLAELAPELIPPGQTRSVAALLADLDDPLRVEKL